MLRLAFTADARTRADRLAEVRDLMTRLDGEPALGAPMAGAEFTLERGYQQW